MSAPSMDYAEPELIAPPTAEPSLAASFPAFLAGFVGTLVGAALFPPVWFAIMAFSHVGTSQPATNRDWAGAAVFYFALWIGMGTWAVAYTALEAAFVFPFVAMIHALVGTYRRRVAFVSIAGGCTGMAATIFWLQGAGLPEFMAATMWGQLFAASAARLAKSRRASEIVLFDQSSAPRTPGQTAWRFSMRRLLALVTAAAIVLTVLVRVSLGAGAWLAVAAGFAAQSLALSVYYMGAALFKGEPHVPRETTPPVRPL
jgi:hypothetical protein